MKSLFVFSAMLFSVVIFAQKNLIQNGGFDSNTENWRGESLTSNRIYKNSGSGSGMINQFVGQDWKGVDQITSIPKGAFAIEFSVYIKTEGIEGGKEKYNAGVMVVAFTTSGEKNISNENIAEVHGTSEWTLYKKLVIIPADAKKIRTMLALAQTPGTIYFDDVKAIALSQEEYQKIISQKN